MTKKLNIYLFWHKVTATFLWFRLDPLVLHEVCIVLVNIELSTLFKLPIHKIKENTFGGFNIILHDFIKPTA